MSFWEKIKQTVRSWMTGRNGIDALSATMIWVGLALYLLDAFLKTGILSLLALALYGFALFRALSRNLTARQGENLRFLTAWRRLKARVTQAVNRMRGRKEYKYFKCPNCRAWIRLPRKVGKVTVTCRRCKHSFEKEA